jgi:hypothetical protein
MGNKLLRVVDKLRKVFIFYAIIVILFLIIGITYLILKYSSKVRLKFIKEVKLAAEFKGDYWCMVDENRLKYLENYGIKPEEFEFDKYNIVISEGRKIKEMRYKREKYFPFRKTKFARTILEKELYPNSIFIYQLEKGTKVYLNEKSNYKMEIEIEK